MSKEAGDGSGAADMTENGLAKTLQQPSHSREDGTQPDIMDESVDCAEVDAELPVLDQLKSDATLEKDITERDVQCQEEVDEPPSKLDNADVEDPQNDQEDLNESKAELLDRDESKFEQEETASLWDKITTNQQTAAPLLQSITGLKIDDVLEMEASLAKISDGTKREADFVNHGYLKWEEGREKWLRRAHHMNNNYKIGDEAVAATSRMQKHAKPLPVDDIIDIIFAIPGKATNNIDDGPTPFPEPVPLPQMVDILQDLWEAEGLDV